MIHRSLPEPQIATHFALVMDKVTLVTTAGFRTDCKLRLSQIDAAA